MKFIWNLNNSYHALHYESIVSGSFCKKGSKSVDNIRYFMYKYDMYMYDWEKPHNVTMKKRFKDNNVYVVNVHVSVALAYVSHVS